jgi:hypothetical protein
MVLRCGRYYSIVVTFLVLWSVVNDGFSEQPDITPQSLEFRRQATRRMVFDRSQHILLASLQPGKIVGLDLMHPAIGERVGDIRYSVEGSRLSISTEDQNGTSERWVGGFNPFATFELSLQRFKGTGRIGIRFADPNGIDYLSACVIAANGQYQAIEWMVVKDGKEVILKQYAWPKEIPDNGPVRLRVQMQAVGVNIYLESQDKSFLVAYPDFNNHFELRRKELIGRYEFRLYSQLEAQSMVEIDELLSALTPGNGQADIRAITTQSGEPLLDQGRLWLTMTVRGRALPHPMQGVFSMNPSVFDLKFEGIIVFDMGDGLWRNELASHIFYDETSKQWRGWTTGFSALGTTAKKEEKAILAISSDRDPRRGFSIMKARPVGLTGQHEDPHGVYDAEAGKWRLLLAEKAGKFRAGIWESDNWDGGYQRLAGPVEMDSTGTLIQRVGKSRYVFFGSADRKVYIRSYPDLNPVGELKMHLPPWNESTGTRIWPNIIPLPDGYPAPYIALMMDRQNFPDMPTPNWTYGAMYLYHAYP